jgi:ATP-dependent Clp protease adaptor protein ClpS
MFQRKLFLPDTVALRDPAWSDVGSEMITDFGHNFDLVASKAAACAFDYFDDRWPTILMANQDQDHVENKDTVIGDDDSEAGVVTRTKPKTKKPAMYKVIMLNDDYTPMEFVILVLERFFNKTHEESTQIMLHVHQKGVGVCGVFTFEVAETKVQKVMDLARQHQHPFQCTLEKA